MTTVQASIAASRFGMGPKPGELAAIAPDPLRWLLQQISETPPIPRRLADYPSTAVMGSEVADALMNNRRMGRPNNEAEAQARQEQRRMAMGRFRRAYQQEAGARTLAAMESDTPFYERLVHFWSNHFTVSSTKPQAQALLGGFEREAIRPHVLGKFRDMLRASSQHAAMLIYLDQAQSIGPGSMAGQFGDRGLNENLAREILELHTLGVNGGYTQDDVIALAKILTGWTVGAIRSMLPARMTAQIPQVDGGAFVFVNLFHEPGTKVLLGQSFNQGGVNEGLAALDMLARHPSTAQFIATKMARHFIDDEPPADAVATLAQAFRQSDGDLRFMAQTLVSLRAVWSTPLPKVRTPNDYVIAMGRAIQLDPTERDVFRALRDFGQPPFGAPSPAGWPDHANAWLAPESLMRRIEGARMVAEAMPSTIDPGAFLEATIGPVANADTLLWVARAPDRIEGLAMTLASPEFQRR